MAIDLKTRGRRVPLPDTHAPRADLLTGFAEIGSYLGWTKRQAQHRSDAGEIPTFRMGRTVCARMSSLDAHIAKLEEAANGKRL